MDYILEQFNLDPLRMFDEPLFEDGFEEMRTLLIEATAGANKENILQKIIKAIRGAIEWIVKKLKQFFSWITEKIFGKQPGVSADQICTEIGIKPNPTQAPADNKGVKVTIPADPASEVTPPDIEGLYKNIFASFDHDVKAITIRVKDIMNVNTEENMHKGFTINGIKAKPVLTNAIPATCALVEDPGMLKMYLDATKMLSDGSYANNINKFTENVNKIVRFWSLPRFVEEGYKFNIDKLMNLNNTMAEVGKSLEPLMSKEKVIDPKDPNYNNVVNGLNQLANIMFSIQLAIGSIMSVMGNVYRVDMSYAKSIHDIHTLTKFVGRCIQGNIPGKYIVWNSYVLCDDTLTGGANQDKPIWGQTRFLFKNSPKNSVYKIAYTNHGIQSNKMEKLVSDKLRSIGGSNLIAVVLGFTEDYITLEEEMVDTSTKLDNIEAKTVADKANQLLQKNGISWRIYDAHGLNAGTKNGQNVLLDYGEFLHAPKN